MCVNAVGPAQDSELGRQEQGEGVLVSSGGRGGATSSARAGARRRRRSGGLGTAGDVDELECDVLKAGSAAHHLREVGGWVVKRRAEALRYDMVGGFVDVRRAEAQS